MADLARRSGVSRETIRFYLRGGLLPPPRRKTRNMAWYGDEHLERLRAIRSLREERGLPLGIIRRLLDRTTPVASDADLAVIARILSMTPPERDAAAREKSIPAPVLARARALGLVSREEGFGPGDARVLEAIAQAAGDPDALDYTLEDMGVCARHLERMVQDEAKLFFRSLAKEEVPARTLGALRAGRGAVARFVAAYRAKLLYGLVEEAIAGIARAVRSAGARVLPPLGAADRRRGRYAERAASLRRDREADAHELARLHLGAGEPGALASLAAEALARGPGDPFWLTMLGIARLDAGDAASAVEPLEAAAFADPAAGLPRAFLGAAVLSSLGAPGTSIVADGQRGLRLLDAALRSRVEPPDGRWVRWLAAVAWTSLPAVLGRSEQGQALLREIAASRPRPADLEGIRLRAGARALLR
jgi:DNA-binding transcriptional MerR regulator